MLESDYLLYIWRVTMQSLPSEQVSREAQCSPDALGAAYLYSLARWTCHEPTAGVWPDLRVEKQVLGQNGARRTSAPTEVSLPPCVSPGTTALPRGPSWPAGTDFWENEYLAFQPFKQTSVASLVRNFDSLLTWFWTSDLEVSNFISHY